MFCFSERIVSLSEMSGRYPNFESLAFQKTDLITYYWDTKLNKNQNGHDGKWKYDEMGGIMSHNFTPL